MTLSPPLSLPNLHSSFLSCPLKFKPSARNLIQPKPTSYPRIRALEFDQNTVPTSVYSLVFYLYNLRNNISFCCFSQIELNCDIVNVFNFRWWL